jgi:hypothetical protein
MTIADEARDNALHFEAVKYAYRQNREGIVVSFVVHPNDIPDGLSTSRIGTRFMVALVEIDDNEQARPQPDNKPLLIEAKRTWNDFQPAQQAGIRSHDVRFAQFLEEEYVVFWDKFSDAAKCIRAICDVHSRSQLGTDHSKRVLWNQLDKHFQAWEAKIRMNA